MPPGKKVIETLAKGQITLPNEFRTALGITEETLLSVSLVGNHLEISPLHSEGEALRRYTDEDISAFVETDGLDEGTARRVRELLRHGKP